MYFIDARHYLDEKDAIGPRKGPVRAMAEFCGNVIAHATDLGGIGVPAPKCFKCKEATVEAAIADNDAVFWSCARCATEGEISHWQGRLWDLRQGGTPRA